MSVDAFAVAVGRGTVMDHPRLGAALRTGAVFGLIEATTPFLGWLAGMAASDWVAAFDHWLAFGLLAGVGLHMISSAFRHDRETARPANHSPLMLVATAFGSSIDAMVVGASLALLDIGMREMLVISAAIGLATFVMATIGLKLGKVIGDRFGAAAEVCAGLFLCVLGTAILIEHLTA